MMTRGTEVLLFALKKEVTVLKMAFFLLVVLLAGNLNAIVDNVLHPEILYFDKEHLIVGGTFALMVCVLFLIFVIYHAKHKMAEEAIKKLNEDLSERVRQLSEAKIMADAASKAKSEFLANMSHELTTPLNSIIGFSQIFQDGLYGDLNENQKEYVSVILKSGNHLSEILNNMLDISKLDSGTGELKKNRFLLKDLLTTMIISFKEKSLEKNIFLGFEIAPEAEIEIEADLGMMKQIMFNLLDNALKFTPDGGSVRVTARKVPSSELGVRSEKESKELGVRISERKSINSQLITQYSELDFDFIEINVEDTGIGIKPEEMEHLFQAFTQLESPYTKKYAGAGLGLALTKKLVELHGGRIWAESEYGKGSRFTFVIPVNQGG